MGHSVVGELGFCKLSTAKISISKVTVVHFRSLKHNGVADCVCCLSVRAVYALGLTLDEFSPVNFRSGKVAHRYVAAGKSRRR